MIVPEFSQLRGWLQMAWHPSVPGADADVRNAHDAALIKIDEEYGRGALVFLAVAAALLLEIQLSFTLHHTLLWGAIFVGFQAFRLLLQHQFGALVADRTRLLVNALAYAVPFGILAFVTVDQLDQTRYMLVTLMHVFLVVTVMALYPGFIELHRVYGMVLLGSIAFAWLFSGFESRYSMWLMLMILTVALEMASRRVYRYSMQKIRLELANRSLTQRLQEKVGALEELNRSKTSLLAAACHDLRQPVHAMGLLIESVLSLEGDARRLRQLEQLQRSNTTSANMLSALMDLARLDSGALKAVPVATELQEILTEARIQFLMLAQQKGLALHIPVTDLRVFSDPYLLRRVVFNLLSNAVKYTREGEVVLSLRCIGNQVHLAVSDTGIGIAQSWQARIFEEYARPERGEGLGIGLATVKRACALMRHPLTFESRLGKGTVFAIQLDMAPAETATMASSTEPLAETGPRLRRERLIVVIEDDAMTRRVTVDLLRQWDFKVIDASNSRELIQSLQGSRLQPSLVMADLHLRHENGLSAIYSLRALPGLKALPAMVITGDTSPSFQQMANQTFVSVLHKPVSPLQLRRTIDTLMA